MNEHVVDQFEAWREALRTGKPVAYERGQPTAGYFKRRGRNDDRSVRFDAVAIWRDGAKWDCEVSAGYAPRTPDEIEEMFVGCNSSPITFELFESIMAGGAWPDEVAPVEIAADLPPHARADAELTAHREALAAWIKEIGKVSTQEQADKAGNFAGLFDKIEKASDEARKAEKEPHLESGRAVDAKWQPVVKRAAELKAWAKKSTEAFLIAEKARIIADERAAVEARAKSDREAAEARRQAEATGAPPPAAPAAPEPPPPPQKAKAGKVHLRTEAIYEVVDRAAFLRWLASQNDLPDDFLAVLKTLGSRMVKSGANPEGVIVRTEERAA